MECTERITDLELKHLVSILKGKSDWNYKPVNGHLFCPCGRTDKCITRGMAIHEMKVICLNSSSHTMEKLLARILKDPEVKKIIQHLPRKKKAIFKKIQRRSSHYFRS